MVYGRVRHVRCNSRFTYENSLLAISGRSATIISSATPFEHLEKQALQKPTRLAPLNSCMVLSVRSMEPRARIDLLIDVAERAQQQNIPFSFVVAGKGPLLEQYRSEIRSRHLSNITLLGYVSDLELVRLYAGCDVVLMTCESGEGFGLPVIEGYLFGKPVVASNRCAVPEVIISQDHLVENNSAEILDRLTSFISLRPPADTFRAYYQQHFSSRVFEEKFHDFYEAIFSGLKSGPDARLSAGKIRQTGVPSR
jgi:glycosyltransferase involved in cell wall biosynthesis